MNDIKNMWKCAIFIIQLVQNSKHYLCVFIYLMHKIIKYFIYFIYILFYYFSNFSKIIYLYNI